MSFGPLAELGAAQRWLVSALKRAPPMGDQPSPTVVIVEPYQDFAATLQEVVALAHCYPVTIANAEGLNNLAQPPAAIVVRVATNQPFESPHAGLAEMPRVQRPVVVALTSSDEDVEEAERLGCELVLREPQQVRGLYDALTQVVKTGRVS